MSNYISAVNEAIMREIAQVPHAIVYGESIDNGSMMSGLSRNITVQDGGRVINIGNCEETHCGVGFGLMLKGVPAVLIAKQLDFLLLGVEQMVSTYSNIRSHRDVSTLGSFTIITVICDQGYQGPQSSFNGLGDICSMAKVPGYMLTNSQDTTRVVQSQLNRPGFRFICLSQRLYPTEFLELDLVQAAEDCSVFQYYEGDDTTIVCFNLSLPEGLTLHKKIVDNGRSAALFSANYVFPQDWQLIRDSVTHTRKLVMIDDSKSVNLLGHRMMSTLSEQCPPFQSVTVTREDDIDFRVGPDDLQVDYEDVIARLGV